ncbi:MAG: amidohydrolase [Deltaproteobacteria bacterium]|nr:amidohydrolase [Deltaproteobacteria bacterium]
MQIYKAPYIYSDGAFLENHALVEDRGVIQDILPISKLKPTDSTVIECEDLILLPGTINTHNHSFQSLVRGFSDDRSFSEWRDQGIYKFSKLLDQNGIYTGALFAFYEMILNGVTTVCDFFYIHDGGNQNARAVIQAAHDVGIRLVLARCLYDWKGAPSQYQESVSQAKKNCLSLIDEVGQNSMCRVYPAPHSLHGASQAMIEAGMEIAREKNSYLHMHIAEAKYEVEQVKKKYGKTPLKFLNHIGACSDRLVGVHCVWIDDEEVELMAEKQVKLSYNPASNMYLGDGVTPILKLLKRNVIVGLGTDGACSNNRTSVFDEMRTCSLLQKLTHLDGAVCPAETSFKMGTENGGKILGIPTGVLKPGNYCDFVGIRVSDISLLPFKTENLVKNIVYAMSPRAIDTVVVQGREVVKNGYHVSLSPREVYEKVQNVTRGWK